MTRTRVHDVAVVGARAAGAATAMLLARHGLDVVVVEQGAPAADTLSTHALMRCGVVQLARWDLLDGVIAAGTPAVRHTRFTYADQQVDLAIKPSHGIDALYAPRRTVLDPLIASAATESGADVRYRTRLTGLIHRGGRPRGIRTCANGRCEDLLADLVIGADGVHSTVARLVGAQVEHRGTHAMAVTYGYWSGLAVCGYEWIFRPDACAGAIPTNHGQTCVFASASPERIGRGGIDVIEQAVGAGDPDLAHRLADASAPAGTRTWAGRPGYLRRAHGPGWALVGDAGYYKDPISAHGLTDALRDAELLAAAVVQGGDAEPRRSSVLADYQSTTDRPALPLLQTVDRIASNDWGDSEISELLVQLSAAMARSVDAITSSSLDQQPVR
jgi:2-polyprenyl-6-methoxyphenol hydroxylase-like FAD-dependent oxidoreductase